MTATPQQIAAATPTAGTTATTSAELPIYQRLLDELDPAARDTIIAQQGEGHAPSGETADTEAPLGRHR